MKKLFGPSALLVACACVQLGALAQGTSQNAPDNTAQNKSDKNSDRMTAEKTSNSKGDVNITRELRKSIMATKGLSVDAQNVKIITKNGVVTLRGPVETESEKATIDGLVKGCPSVQSCNDELRVKKP